MDRSRQLKRRDFLGVIAGGAAVLTSSCAWARGAPRRVPEDPLPPPNLVYVFADQWRAQATGYAGDPNVQTPCLDRLARESVNCTMAVSGQPVCCPYRASLLTGRYPLSHRVILNDLCLNTEAVSIAQAYRGAGYQTAYIGKWHLDGHGRSSFIPPERRQGFEFWKALECTHDYNHSYYYGDSPEKRLWDGYDAIAQTREAQRYLREETGTKPFVLFLSWGPPHNPYETAPREYRDRYDPATLVLRSNVPADETAQARRDLAGYYAHCTALDTCVGALLATLREIGKEENTIFVFTSDHGDMLGSQGEGRKQRPWDEAVRVPFLMRCPARFGQRGRTLSMPISTPDIMPTLLGLCGIAIPDTVEGRDCSPYLLGRQKAADDPALIACYAPFGEWTRSGGGREYRGVRTRRYTYVRDLQGPWLLYDNHRDPYQLINLCGQREHVSLQSRLDTALQKRLAETHDAFLPGETYIKQWGYTVDKTGTAPITQ